MARRNPPARSAPRATGTAAQRAGAQLEKLRKSLEQAEEDRTLLARERADLERECGALRDRLDDLERAGASPMVRAEYERMQADAARSAAEATQAIVERDAARQRAEEAGATLDKLRTAFNGELLARAACDADLRAARDALATAGVTISALEERLREALRRLDPTHFHAGALAGRDLPTPRRTLEGDMR